MIRRNFIATLYIILLATPAFARTYPPITLNAFSAALAELEAEFPARFAALGTRIEGPLQRRGAAIYVKYENGRLRLMQQKDGTFILPLDALVLKTDTPERKDNDDPQDTQSSDRLTQSTGAQGTSDGQVTSFGDGNPRNPTGHTPHCHGPC